MRLGIAQCLLFSYQILNVILNIIYCWRPEVAADARA